MQRFRKAVEPAGQCRPTWLILQDLAVRLGASVPYEREEHIFDDLAREVGAFNGMDYKKIGRQGLVWSVK